MEKEDLRRLVLQAQAGDGEAMTQLLRHAHTPVSYQCRKFMKRPEDAEDMTQEVLTRIFQKLDSLQEPEKFNSWANSIAAHLCINALKKDPGELQFLEDQEGSSILDVMEDPDQQTVPHAVVEDRETRRMVTDLIDALPAPQRTATYLYYFDELSVKEIAQLIGVSESTIKSRLNYARKAIQTGVLDYEKKGFKLYGVSPLPLLLYFLRQEMEAGANAAAADAAVQAVLSQGAAAAAAAGTAQAAGAAQAAGVSQAAGAAQTAGAAAAGKAAAGGLGAKVAAGALAAALAVGGLALTRQAPEPPAPTPTPVATPSPTPVPAEAPFTVQRTTVETGRADVVIYLEAPVFEEPGGSCDGVNAVFDDLRQSYLDGTDPNVSFILSHLDSISVPITLEEVYTVQSQDRETVSLSASFSWTCEQPGWFTQSLGSGTNPDFPVILYKATGLCTDPDLDLINQNIQAQMLQDYGSGDPKELVRLPQYGSHMMIHYRPQFCIMAGHGSP